MRLMGTLYHTSDPILCIIPVQEYYHQVNIVHPNTRFILSPHYVMSYNIRYVLVYHMVYRSTYSMNPYDPILGYTLCTSLLYGIQFCI
jgi:hypothetical protein